MVRSYHAAKAVTRVGETFGYRLGACASVALIRDAPAIFPRRVPEPGAPLGDFAYRGYLAGAAFVLAISVTECFAEVTLPVWHQTEARDNFLDHVNQIIDDPEYTQRNAVLALVDCLHEFREAGDQLADAGIPADFMRVRGFPFVADVRRFVEEHEHCFVVEQNRDGQLRTLIATETGVAIERMDSILAYGGFPLSAQQVVDHVLAKLEG